MLNCIDKLEEVCGGFLLFNFIKVWKLFFVLRIVFFWNGSLFLNFGWSKVYIMGLRIVESLVNMFGIVEVRGVIILVFLKLLMMVIIV